MDIPVRRFFDGLGSPPYMPRRTNYFLTVPKQARRPAGSTRLGAGPKCLAGQRKQVGPSLVSTPAVSRSNQRLRQKQGRSMLSGRRCATRGHWLRWFGVVPVLVGLTVAGNRPALGQHSRFATADSRSDYVHWIELRERATRLIRPLPTARPIRRGKHAASATLTMP